MSEIFSIDDAWDCESIKRRINDLETAKSYPSDLLAEINQKPDILERRKTELGC